MKKETYTEKLTRTRHLLAPAAEAIEAEVRKAGYRAADITNAYVLKIGPEIVTLRVKVIAKGLLRGVKRANVTFEVRWPGFLHGASLAAM